MPADAVTASGSGLDPEHLPAYAELHRRRASLKTRMDRDQTQFANLVASHTDGRTLGFLGEPGVNVVELNIAPDPQRIR